MFGCGIAVLCVVLMFVRDGKGIRSIQVAETLGEGTIPLEKRFSIIFRCIWVPCLLVSSIEGLTNYVFMPPAPYTSRQSGANLPQ